MCGLKAGSAGGGQPHLRCHLGRDAAGRLDLAVDDQAGRVHGATRGDLGAIGDPHDLGDEVQAHPSEDPGQRLRCGCDGILVAFVALPPRIGRVVVGTDQSSLAQSGQVVAEVVLLHVDRGPARRAATSPRPHRPCQAGGARAGWGAHQDRSVTRPFPAPSRHTCCSSSGPPDWVPQSRVRHRRVGYLRAAGADLGVREAGPVSRLTILSPAGPGRAGDEPNTRREAS